MATVRGPRIVTSGLVLALDAADKKSYSGSGTTWFDLSQNNNNGTLVNGPTFDATNGGSLVFNGTSTYCSITNLNGLNIQKPTHEVWFKLVNPTDGINRQIFTRRNLTNTSFNILKNNANKFQAQCFDSTGVLISLTLTSTPTTNWTNIALTYDGTTVRSYVNGVADTTSGALSVAIDTGGTLAIYVGANVPLTGYTNGNISIARIYNRALSASEVLQNFNATRGRFGI